MTQQFVATVTLPLPADPKEAASALAILMQEWCKFLSVAEALQGSAASFEFRNVRGPRGNGVRRGRKPRVALGAVTGDWPPAAA